MSYATLSPYPVWQITDAIGGAIPGALLYVYQANTDTPITTYTDASMSTAAANPIVSDGDGRLSVWLNPATGSVKMILTDGVGLPDIISGRTGTEIWSRDYIAPVGGGSSSGTLYIVENIAALKALAEPEEFTLCQVLGYYAQGDGGGGEFYWDQSSSDANDDGVTIQPTVSTAGRWKRQIGGSEINVKWYGAYGTGSTNDSPFFIAANTFCDTGNYSLVADAGTYLLSSDPSLTNPIRLLPNAKLKPTADGYVFDVIIEDDTQHFLTDYIVTLQAGIICKPQWWGAVADGTTDDTAAVRKAAEAISAGGTIYFKSTATSYLVGDAGDYVVTLTSNMHVKGDGDASALKQKGSTNSTYAIIGHDVSGALSDVTVDDISIDGNRSNNTAGVGVLVNSVGGHIYNCNIIHCFTKAIDSYGAYFNISGNTLVDNGLLISNSDHVIVDRNNITATDNSVHSTYGISVSPGSSKAIVDTAIRNNVLVGCPLIGVAAPTTSDITSLEVSGNSVDLSRTSLAGYSNSPCISLLNFTGKCKIFGNTLRTSGVNTSSGIYFGDTATVRTTNSDISDNTIYLITEIAGLLHNGISIKNTDACVIKNNTIIFVGTNGTNHGIAELGTCTNITYGINNIIGFTYTTSPYVSIKVGERLAITDSGTCTAAANLVLGKGNINTINTSVSTVNLIDSTGWIAGSVAILEFTGTITLKHGITSSSIYKSIIFKDGADFVTSPLTTLVLKYDGTSWYEIFNARSSHDATYNSITFAVHKLTLANGSAFRITSTSGDIWSITYTGFAPGSIIYLVADNQQVFHHDIEDPPTGAVAICTPSNASVTMYINRIYTLLYTGTYWLLSKDGF